MDSNGLGRELLREDFGDGEIVVRENRANPNQGVCVQVIGWAGTVQIDAPVESLENVALGLLQVVRKKEEDSCEPLTG